MCGILGVVGPVDQAVFRKSLDRLTHRGPDGSGVWSSDVSPATLGHRRLSIIDTTEHGGQPMQSGDCIIVFNGEIYNFLEIRAMLESHGCVFRSQSDTEILLAAYKYWGPACLAKLNGMWAFAVWNMADQTLFLARDRFGKKPLFYSFQAYGLVFGSEMKALMPLMERVEASRNFAWMASNLCEYEQTEKCLVEGIYRFPAGSHALISMGDIASRRIRAVQNWNTLDNLVDVPQRYEDQVDRFRELFVDACRIRMRSDVPIGTALSGGIDSSAVACTMNYIAKHRPDQRQAHDWQNAFIATFPGSELDESQYARDVTDLLGIQGTFLPVDAVSGLDSLFEYLYLFEELYLTTPVPMIQLYSAVRSHGVRVTIDGHGADELLSGYGGFRTALKDSFPNVAYLKHVLQICGVSNAGYQDIYRGLVDINHGHRGLAKFLAAQVLTPRRENPLERRFGYLNEHLYYSFHQGILPTLLRNYDRYSMAAGVEIRMPFMDHRLVSYCFSLPWQSKAPRTSTFTKAILRDAIGNWMPDSVRYRRSKIGFNTPVSDWMKGPWKEFIQDSLQSSSFAGCSLIDARSVKAQVERVIASKTSLYEGDAAWAAMMPWLWEKAFLKHAGS